MIARRFIPEPFGATLIAYCDGSCPKAHGPGGWGYVLLVGNNQYTDCGGHLETTNQLMEMEAAYRTLRGVIAMGFSRDQPLLVCTDSMYVVNGMGEWGKKWKRNGYAKVQNVEQWQRLHHKAEEFDHLTFAWVRGHSGHYYNEIADKLADKGRVSTG